ncbi:putative disease resistance RPP13-like protein 2 [Pistacia vera]|uniref:putative disease resistance RPP13-like protein 2 n=1 Tax=Pistacia vera TaxID=55513 RepID=UPI001262F89F|nr:putative disease resistance RPP13-like protein 2 [Pistacia vera]
MGHFTENLPIDNMTKLQTLKYVKVSAWNQVKKKRLVNLRELKIFGDLHARNDKFTFDSIANLKCLRILSVALQDPSIGHFGSLEPVSHCEHLQDLHLEGTIHNVPENLHELVPNLECLSLERSNLKDDPMPKLEKLLKLSRLHLGWGSYVGRKMICSAKSFLRLKILNLCLKFDEWEVKEGALPVLGDLKIFEGTELIIPERLRSINILILPIPATDVDYIARRDYYQL